MSCDFEGSIFYSSNNKINPIITFYLTILFCGGYQNLILLVILWSVQVKQIFILQSWGTMLGSTWDWLESHTGLQFPTVLPLLNVPNNTQLKIKVIFEKLSYKLM